MPERPLLERLTEYAVAMRGTGDQLAELERIALENGYSEVDLQPIRDGVKLYTIVADDLDKIIRGEELKPFIVEAML